MHAESSVMLMRMIHSHHLRWIIGVAADIRQSPPWPLRHRRAVAASQSPLRVSIPMDRPRPCDRSGSSRGGDGGAQGCLHSLAQALPAVCKRGCETEAISRVESNSISNSISFIEQTTMHAHLCHCLLCWLAALEDSA